MKSITQLNVIAKEWFDKINGNSYFSARINVNKDTFYLPLQYGYDSAYIQATSALLKAHGFNIGDNWNIEKFCKDNNIPATFHKYEKCLKKEVKAWGIIG